MLPELPGSEKGLFAVRKFHSPFGVPELLAITGDPSIRRERLKSPVPPLLNEIDAGIAAVTPRSRAVSTAAIANSLGWSKQSIERRIPHVVRTGAVIRNARGNYTRVPSIRPLGHLCTIELKVADWQHAVKQCRTSLLWANAYVLVLDR